MIPHKPEADEGRKCRPGVQEALPHTPRYQTEPLILALPIVFVFVLFAFAFAFAF
jgi:hypothetical protein